MNLTQTQKDVLYLLSVPFILGVCFLMEVYLAFIGVTYCNIWLIFFLNYTNKHKFNALLTEFIQQIPSIFFAGWGKQIYATTTK